MLKIIKFFFETVLILIVVLALLLVYARYIEPHRLTVTEISIANENLPEGAGDTVIAVFADTHFSDYYTPVNFEKAIAAINAKSPDIILFCGDLIDHYDNYGGSPDAIADALLKLNASIGKFAVYGNHDHGGGAHRAYDSIMENGGFKILSNEYVEFEDIGLILIGLDDFVLGNGNTGVITDAVRPGWFNLVLCHEPDIIDDIPKESVDLMVSGHTHGGQINIPGYKHVYYPPYGRNYDKGRFDFDNASHTVLYVNSGLGSTMLPFRFMAPPEISFFYLSRN